MPAHAALLDARGNAPGLTSPAPVLDDVQLITGSSTVATEFSITAEGTYTVTLTDLMFPDPFQELALAITSATTTFGTLTAPGSMDLVLDGPTKLFALVFGVPNAHTGVGLYGVRIVLADNGGGGGNPVPLPAAIWLFASALFGTFLRRIRSRAPDADPSFRARRAVARDACLSRRCHMTVLASRACRERRSTSPKALPAARG